MWAILLTALVALQPAAPASPPAAAAYRQGVAAEAKNDLAAALAAYDQAIAAEPSMAIAHDRRGFVLGRLGRTGDALVAFERAATLDPRLFDAQYHLGATR
jgi:tetratricopeptide (TPR) repeat protein